MPALEELGNASGRYSEANTLPHSSFSAQFRHTRVLVGEVPPVCCKVDTYEDTIGCTASWATGLKSTFAVNLYAEKAMISAATVVRQSLS